MQGVEPLSDEGVVEHYVEKREGSTTQQIRVSEASQQERGHPFGQSSRPRAIPLYKLPDSA